MPVCFVNFSIRLSQNERRGADCSPLFRRVQLRAFPFANIDEMAFDCCGGSHHRAYEMRAPALALPTLEIAIGRARRAFAARQYVVIHRDAHAAAGLAPFETRAAENPVESFFLSCCFYLHGTGHN